MAPKAQKIAASTPKPDGIVTTNPPASPRLVDIQPYDAFDAGLDPWLVLSIVNANTLRPMALGVHVLCGGGLRHTRIAVSRFQYEYKRFGANETAKALRAYQRALKDNKGAR